MPGENNDLDKPDGWARGREGEKKEPEKERGRPSNAYVNEFTQNLPIQKVIVHPLVLLSVVDHFSRQAKTGHNKRVVGVLLGTLRGKELDISNSFAVPFDEDEREKDVYFLDHDFLENMYGMFRRVNAKEKIVGWYHTGPKLKPNDININQVLKQFCSNPVLVIVDADPKPLGLPTEAYIEVEEVHDDGTPTAKTFEHVPSEIGAEEAEEVGVEHLLRDIRDITAGTLSQKISAQVQGLRGLEENLREIATYLQDVSKGNLPVNHNVVYLLQDVMNMLPSLSPDFVSSFNVQTNDELSVIYLGTLVRSVISLHNLMNNKISLREVEKREAERGRGDSAAKKAEKAAA